ncbi:MAG TPA: hypothetical protein VMV60_14040 [Thermoanaerobaculia bacterium]|nr:hypothetical protein [Thermoanaerobaculia bacterium]
MASLLARAFDFVLLVLDRTGVAARLAALPVFPAAMPLASRAAWALAALGAAVLLFYSSLAAGRDRRVAAFRVVTLLAACLLPLAAARLVPAGHARPFGGGVLVLVFSAALVHRALAWRRKESVASRFLERLRWLLEAAGIALCLAAAAMHARGGSAPPLTVFGGLLCLRLSIADLLDPSRLAKETGLTASAAKDLKAARSGRARPAHRGRRLVTGLAKLAIAVLWVFLPLLAAVAPGEVARGEWPPAARFLALYPAAALAVTGLLLLAGAARRLVSNPLEAARGAVVGAGTLLWLWLVLGRAPAGIAIAALPGLYAAETLAGFLFGAASRGR